MLSPLPGRFFFWADSSMVSDSPTIQQPPAPFSPTSPLTPRRGYGLLPVAGLDVGGPELLRFLVKFLGLERMFSLHRCLHGISHFILCGHILRPYRPWPLAAEDRNRIKRALAPAWMAFCMGMGVADTLSSQFRAPEELEIRLYFYDQAVGLIFRGPSGRLSDRRGRMAVIIPGLCLIAVGLLMLPSPTLWCS